MEPAFEDCEAQLTIHLHPSKLRRLGESLALEFDKLLLSYSRDLRAIVLAHSDQRLIGTSLTVDSFLWPYVRADIALRLCLYRVVPGQLIGAHMLHPSSLCNRCPACPACSHMPTHLEALSLFLHTKLLCAWQSAQPEDPQCGRSGVRCQMRCACAK